MSHPRTKTVLLSAVLLTTAGCHRGPELTSRQVEQVFETQEHVAEQQASLSRGRDDLEADRRIWDQRARNDPIVAETIEATGILLACCVPLIVLILLLGRFPRDEAKNDCDERLLAETFLREFPSLTEQDSDVAPQNLPTT